MRISSLGILTPGTYNIDIRPYFSDGGTGTYPGVWSTVRQLCVVAPAMPIFGEDQALENAKTLTNGAEVILYPNPTNGEFVNFNIKGINSDNVQVRVIDAMGRSIFNKRYVVDGSLNTVLTFDAPLASGLYMVEYIIDGEVQTQRMVVQK
jgi:streptogramin lyase